MTPTANCAARQPAQRLSDVYQPGANAFAFLRFTLAGLVMAGHSWEVGGFGADPLQRQSGVTLGAMAVHAFFVVGGFLVAGSFTQSTSISSYLAKRALRILPGFWACLIISAAFLVPLAVALSPRETAPETGGVTGYVLNNFLVRLRQTSIGTVFSTHPAAGVVNGSLWSLFPELLCYISLALLGAVGLLRGARRIGLTMIFGTSAVVFFLGTTFLTLASGKSWQPQLWYILQLVTLGTFFVAGALLWAARDLLPFTPHFRGLVLGILVVVLATGNYPVFGVLALPPAILVLAVSLPWRNFDRYGDFSYGLYLYHYPVQQVLIAIDRRTESPWVFFIQTLFFTLPLAFISWHLVERPALRLKLRLRSQIASP